MGPDLLFLAIIIILVLGLLIARVDVALLSFVLLASWHVGAMFIDEVFGLVGNAAWFIYLGLELLLRLGLVVLAAFVLRRQARGSFLTRFPLTVFVVVLASLFLSQILTSYPQVSFTSSYSARLLDQYSHWIQAGLLIAAFVDYLEAGPSRSRRKSRK